MKAAHQGGRGKCSICSHPDHADIDAAILAGGSQDAIADRYGLNRSSIRRHKLNHAPRELGHGDHEPSASLTPVVSGTAVDIPQELRAQFDRTLAAIESAERRRSDQAINNAHREHRLTLQLISDWNDAQRKLELLAKPQSVVRLENVGGYPEFRWILLDVLTPHPDLRAEIDRRMKLKALEVHGVEPLEPTAFMEDLK